MRISQTLVVNSIEGEPDGKGPYGALSSPIDRVAIIDDRAGTEIVMSLEEAIRFAGAVTYFVGCHHGEDPGEARAKGQLVVDTLTPFLERTSG